MKVKIPTTMNNQKHKILDIIKSKLLLSSSSNNEFIVNKIIILGFGVEGKSSFKFLIDNIIFFSLDIKIIIADKRDKNDIIINSSDEIKNYFEKYKDCIEFITDEYFSDLLLQKRNFDFDLIIKSPGISLSDSFINNYYEKITSQIDIFLLALSNQVIGITGTKGKSTTATLSYKILLDQGKNTILAGNIGKAVFDTIDDLKDDSIIVLELSCHQLQLISQAPRISILLNIYPEHLDYYKTFEKYKQAKYNIISKQKKDNDIFIFPEKEFDITELENLSPINNKAIYYNTELDSSNKNLSFDPNKVKLPGKHNYFNIFASMIAVKEILQDELSIKLLKESIYKFTGLEHRLEFVGKFKNINFYNDSISTIPQTTIAALRTFNNKVDTLILGGKNRSSEIIFNELAIEISKSDIKSIFFMPDTGEIIFQELLNIGYKENNEFDYIQNESDIKEVQISKDNKTINCFFSKNLQSIVKENFVLNNNNKESICLLSPASSSYNLFKNFEDRGKKFKDFVKK